MQTYHNQGGIIQGRGQLVREYVGNLQDNTEALRSNFSGISAPSNPTIGQEYYNTVENIKYKFTASGWEPADNGTATQVEVKNSRGQFDKLSDRLSVSLNNDGTLKNPATAVIDEWKENALITTYISESSFSTEGDMTTIFTPKRALKIFNGTEPVIAYVKSSEFIPAYDRTTVTIMSDVIQTNLKSVYFSIIQDGQPYGLASNSLTTDFLGRDVDDSSVTISGGQNAGGNIKLNGKDIDGSFSIEANDGTDTVALEGKTDGSLTWNGKNVLTDDGDALPIPGGKIWIE